MLSLSKCLCGISTKMSPNFTTGKVILLRTIYCTVYSKKYFNLLYCRRCY